MFWNLGGVAPLVPPPMLYRYTIVWFIFEQILIADNSAMCSPYYLQDKSICVMVYTGDEHVNNCFASG